MSEHLNDVVRISKAMVMKLRYPVLFSLAVLAFSACVLPPYADASDTKAPTAILDNDILSYLQDVITWRHAIVDGDLSPDNARAVLLKDSLRRNSQQALKSCFGFAHAEGAVLEEAPTSADETAKNADKHARLVQKISDSQQRIDDLKDQAASAADPTTKEKFNGELKIEQAHLELMQNFLTLFNSSESEDTGLSGAINKLSYSILGDLNEAQSPSNASAKPAENREAVLQASGDNVLSIASDMLGLVHRKRSIDSLIEQTSELKHSNQNLINVLRRNLQDAITQGNTLADTPVATDKKSVDKHHKDLDAWFVNYKKLSAAILPLGQINSLLDATTSDLKEWDGILSQEWGRLLRHFLLKLGILCVSLLIPFAFLEIAHRMILRYVRDISRIRQLNVVRQTVFVTLIILVLFLNFFTEFGSLATYAGFLTAGLAVALQTVLVSLTAHFFFFGRFGVKAGDRVTISGVTGDVVQVGILRIYLMELIGEKDALRPSGQIVAFPNSVLFSSSAFSKQISGTNYTWDDLAFSIDSGADFTLANKKIMEIVNSVYGEYKDIIRRQHAALEESTHLSVNMPTPRSEIVVKDSGLTCQVHYPVIIGNAPAIYEKMITQLTKVFATDKDFRMVLANPLKIVPAAKNAV